MNFSALDLNLIRVFDALMAERSATRAGDRIGLSQPAVSAALSRLRHVFNDQLFVRRGNDMVPTPRAEELAPLARAALGQIERMVESHDRFNPATLERNFSIMGSDAVSILIMPALAERVGSKAPGVLLRLRDTATGDVGRLLRDDAIDLAIEPEMESPEGVSSCTAFQSPFLLIAAKDHPELAPVPLGEQVPLDLFCSLPHALRSVDGTTSGLVDGALQALGRHRRVTLTLPHFQAVALAVARSDRIAALPSQFARAVARELPLNLYRLPIEVRVPEIRMFWHTRHDAAPAHRWLREQVVATIRELEL